MNKRELTRIALVVGLSIFVVVIATSDISSLYNPDYLGAVPGTLSRFIRSGADKATAYVRLHGLPEGLRTGHIGNKATWIAFVQQHEASVAAVALLLFSTYVDETKDGL